MCGISGVYHLDGTIVDRLKLNQSADLMRHRGPDGEGYLLLDTRSGLHSLRNGADTPHNISFPDLHSPFGAQFSPNLGFAHRRLAIIDLSPGGHEPMTIHDQDAGEVWITFNGEIYNYLELREELNAKGYTFHTGSDVEVLLQAYDAWGVDCLSRFVGMFAFALWDQKRQRLWCVRDHLGIKPFYYVATPQLFAFASEIKALQPFVKFSPDMAHLAWFLQSGRVYGAPFTFFEGVKELPGGHYLLVENGQVCAPVKWWDIDLDRVQATYQVNSPHNDFLRLMREAVGLQLRSDVPVGTCLSGGLDSSTIVALASEKLRAQPDAGRMNSFSSLYPVKGMDETQYVDIVEKAFNTISHRTSPSPDKFLERLRKITWHQDIPTAGPGVYSQHFVMELARGNVTVLLDGQGSDEMFAGYLLYVMLYLRSLRSHNPIAWLPQQIEFMLGVRARFNSALSLREFLARASKFLRRGSAPVSFISPDMSALAHQRRVELPSRELSGADALNSTLYKHIIYDSIPGLLHYEDRNSMAFGIEARVPFLDHRLVEFSMGVPGHHKIRGPETKVFMRHALKGILPDAIVNRKDKLGYPTPLAQWLRGPLREEITNYLNDVALKRAWYNTAHVRSLWARHLKGEISADWTIYQILTTELWYEQFIA